MMHIFACWIAMLVVVADSPPEQKPSPVQALQPFNDLIGSWRATGEPEGSAQDKQRGFWKETISWSWKFKGNDAWLTVAFGSGKHFRNGELRYLPDKGQYRLTLFTPDQRALVFEGLLKDKTLTLERQDEQKKETQRLQISMLEEIRFVYRYEHKPANRTMFIKDYRVGATREGHALAGAEKKIECVVSGGLGTMPVSHKGTTYHVCCTGCRDAFQENPEKYIKEFEARKAKEGKQK